MNILKKIYLIDLDDKLVDEWKHQFKPYTPVIEAQSCDYFDRPADCMVSPANSFGYMDGGLDKAITYELGQQVQSNLQTAIVQQHHGELPIGSAVIVETGSDKWPYLAAAPTMRIPEDISNTTNAYLAFRAILLAIAKFNESSLQTKICSLVCSGLGTGIGRLSPKQCAVQMKLAYETCLGEARIQRPHEIYKNHKKMKESV